MRVIEVPVATHNHAATISIVGMVADRTHLLVVTCPEDVVAVHDATHPHSMYIAILPHMLGFEGLGSLHTERVAISIPVPTHPFMSMSCVHQRPMAMATSVEEGTLDPLDRHLISSIVAWMREVPAATNHRAFPISIVGVVADRFQSLPLTSHVDVVSSHVSFDFRTLKRVVVPSEADLPSIGLGTQCLPILIIPVRPSVRVACVLQRPRTVSSATVGVRVLNQLLRHSMATSMMRVIDMPVATHDHTATISIAGMVTNRAHLLGLACFENVVTSHETLHFHTVHYMTPPPMLQLEILPTLYTVSVPITIPITAYPLVAVPCVH
jgi:hypothetical protein